MKKLYFCRNDIKNMGFVFKVSDDIVYARGVLRVQMSEMVKFELEGEQLQGTSSRGLKKIGNKVVIKRFYRNSNIYLGNPKNLIKILNTISNSHTNKSYNKIQRINGTTYSELKECNSYNAGLHRGTIEGISGTEENTNIDLYSALTAKDMHYVDITELKVNKIKMPIPTIVIPGIDAITKEEKYERFKSFENDYLIKSVALNKEDLIEFPLKGLGEELRQRNERMMEIIGMEKYKFIKENGILRKVSKDNIKEHKGIIINVDENKFIDVTKEEGYKMCSLVLDGKLDKFINLSKESKDEFYNFVKNVNKST